MDSTAKLQTNGLVSNKHSQQITTKTACAGSKTYAGGTDEVSNCQNSDMTPTSDDIGQSVSASSHTARG